MKMRGGKREGSGRKPLPPYLQRVKLTGVRLTAYKIDALKTQGELTAVIEEALDDKYSALFKDVLTTKRNEEEKIMRDQALKQFAECVTGRTRSEAAIREEIARIERVENVRYIETPTDIDGVRNFDFVDVKQ